MEESELKDRLTLVVIHLVGCHLKYTVKEGPEEGCGLLWVLTEQSMQS